MKNNFIPYEQALKLKELGFDEECLMNHYGEDRVHIGRLYLPSSFGKGKNSEMFGDSLRDKDITAILWQQAFDWFREKHKLIVGWDYGNKKHFYWIVSYDEKLFFEPENKKGDPITYKTYPEAQLACLDKLIEIVEHENNIKN